MGQEKRVSEFKPGSIEASEAGKKSKRSIGMKRVLNEILAHPAPKEWIKQAEGEGNKLPKKAKTVADLLNGRLITEAIFGGPATMLKAQELIHKLRDDMPKHTFEPPLPSNQSFLFTVVERTDKKNEKEVEAEVIND